MPPALQIFEEERQDTLLLLASVTGVAVRERGVGVGADELRCVFEPTYRAEATSASLPGEIGLGLTIAKAIVQRQGLCLWGHRPPGGRGSSFSFCLSRKDGES